ncbi:tRNA pseudouridine(38-40) synthase TruA [Ulvibacterium sp.]|uniref:tRNA pseudouridine(38-40) synthase TruA n=1 Tax=Ulvibacterium sp. TaxID=2665914 RepID=UPI0026266825|nr:tRNA pseudouridine(38-40) synthase TruA [Ulvibacterium sp.]
MRYFVQFSYFGKAYHGWQNQPNAVSVQQILEEAFYTILRHPIELIGAGRTDAGVHALQMFAHFDTKPIADTLQLTHRLNAYLPSDVAIQRIFEVPLDAHARFDALSRTYTYWVVQEKNPFYMDTAYYVRHPLVIETMNEAANLLLSHHDFECFSKSNTDVKTYLCTVKEAYWQHENNKLIFTITANRFLRNMVRAIVGTLLEVGTERWTVDDVNTILKSGDRQKAGPSVPAKGLYLTTIGYPNTIVNIHEPRFGKSV